MKLFCLWHHLKCIQLNTRNISVVVHIIVTQSIIITIYMCMKEVPVMGFSVCSIALRHTKLKLPLHLTMRRELNNVVCLSSCGGNHVQ
jgi:hypothetical protein